MAKNGDDVSTRQIVFNVSQVVVNAMFKHRGLEAQPVSDMLLLVEIDADESAVRSKPGDTLMLTVDGLRNVFAQLQVACYIDEVEEGDF